MGRVPETWSFAFGEGLDVAGGLPTPDAQLLAGPVRDINNFVIFIEIYVAMRHFRNWDCEEEGWYKEPKAGRAAIKQLL